jgi:hypothetical protein
MNPLSVALFIGTALTACAGAPRSGSAPSVPKKSIEKAADTKIDDAGPGDSDGGKSAAR